MTDTPDMNAKMKLATSMDIWEPGGPVTDWTTDYDIRDEAYIEDPVPIWAEMREKMPHRSYRTIGRILEPDSLR